MASVIELTDETLEREIFKSSSPAIVYFWADWCIPCKVIAPIIDEIAKEFSGKIKVGKINIDDNNKMATDLTVMSIPTMIFFKGGEEAGRLTGAVSKETLRRKIEEFFNG